ncbi:18203_t:CDS:2 [Rhizophagus irregularis]|nr:18203_t:CDS:2 [Rhizophagus irregularis]
MTVTPTIDEGYAFIFANCTSSTNPLDLFTSLGKSTAFSLDMENYLFENHLFFIIRSIYKENANSTIACNGTIIDTDNRFPWNLQKFRLVNREKKVNQKW